MCSTDAVPTWNPPPKSHSYFAIVRPVEAVEVEVNVAEAPATGGSFVKPAVGAGPGATSTLREMMMNGPVPSVTSRLTG